MKSNKILYSSILAGATIVTALPIAFTISCSSDNNKTDIENSQVLAKIPSNIDLATLDTTLQNSFKNVIAMNVLGQSTQLNEIFKKYTPEPLTFELSDFNNQNGIANLKVMYKNLSKSVSLTNGFKIITASEDKDLTKPISIELNPKNDQTLQDAINAVNTNFRANIDSTSQEVKNVLLAAKIIDANSAILSNTIPLDTVGGKFIWKSTFSPLYNTLGGMSLTVELQNASGSIGTREIEVLGFKGVSNPDQLAEFNKINQSFMVPIAFKDKLNSITDKEIINFADLLSNPLLKDYSVKVLANSIKPNTTNKTLEAKIVLMNGTTEIDIKPIVITGFN
ncbi:MAG: hypothetical protein ACRCRP_00875 [Metamycoplasmataceae bacterium]